MNPRDQELMERYIYQVVRRLPKQQRHEVALELQELIGDMLEAEESMEEVLTKLGSPVEFAKQYQNDSYYLIGPAYYDNYIWFLKIVLTCTIVAVMAVSVIEAIREGAGLTDKTMIQATITSVIYGITNSIVNLIISGIGAFGGVTLMFAIMERQQIKFDRKKETEWSVNDLGDYFANQKIWMPKYLSPIPHKKALIDRGDSIVEIIFIVIFSVLLIFAPNIFGAVLPSAGATVTVPVFYLEQWHIILPIFILSLVIGLADTVFELIVGHYCYPVMISKIVCGLVQIILSFVIIKGLSLLNPNFMTEIKTHLGESVSSSATFFMNYWNTEVISNGLLFLCVFITVLEIGMTIYKTLRYGIKA